MAGQKQTLVYKAPGGTNANGEETRTSTERSKREQMSTIGLYIYRVYTCIHARWTTCCLYKAIS